MRSRSLLRIAFIVNGDGGSGTYFRYHNLAKGLVLLGHRVVVYGQSGGDYWSTRRVTRDGVHYVLAPSAPGNRWIDGSLNPGNVLWRCFQKIEHADVYHLFQPTEISALPWLALRKFRNTEGALFAWDWDDLWCGGLLTHATAPDMPRWRYRLLDRFEHALPRRAALVTTCSEYLARLARNRGASHTTVIHNGYWPAAPPGDRATLRKEFNLQPDAFYLGFIGWTPAEVTWCLDALTQLDGNVRLASCGYDVRRHLDAYPGITHRVDYLGKLTADRARRLMHAIDAGLLPLACTPFNESRLPIKFADYLAAGVPAICGDVGEVGLLGRRIRGAILCPADKQPWIAGCVNAVREIQRDRSTHLPDGIDLARQLSWSRLVQQLEHAYLSSLQCFNQHSQELAKIPRAAASPVPALLP